MEVKEILRLKDSTLYSVSPETLLSDAVIMMDDHDVGAIVVVEGGKLIGMLTFREIIWGTMPFVALMALAIALICLFPGIAVWLPNVVMNR